MATKTLETLDIRVGTTEQLATLPANPDAIEFNTDEKYPAESVSFDNTGTTLTATDVQAAIAEVAQSSGGSTGTDNNGLEGDYCCKYGIVDETKSGLPTIVSGSTVKIPAQLVLDVPGVNGLTTNASDITYDIKATIDCTLFLANGEVLEATDVFFQESEPEDGTTGYAAWWNGTEWKFKSNDTGNVFRPANAVRIAKCVFTNGTLTRLCFTGCRLLNKQEFVSKQSVPVEEGTYTLKATVAADGTVTTTWVKDA